MSRLLFCLFVVFLLVGCANRWEHSTKRQSEFYADDRECQQAAGSATQAVEPRSDRMSYESCMWERGWTKKRSVWFFEPSEK